MSTKPESRGLVTTIMTEAPRNRTRLRNATETDEPDRGLDLGGIGREPRHHLAGLGRVEEGRRERCEMAEHLAAQVGHDPLAERGDQIEPRGAGEREHRHHADHHREIAVDQIGAFAGEAEIDHAPDRDRHRQRSQRRQHQRAYGRDRPPAIAPEVGPQQHERPQLGLAGGWRRGSRRRRGRRLPAVAQRLPADAPRLSRPHSWDAIHVMHDLRTLFPRPGLVAGRP